MKLSERMQKDAQNMREGGPIVLWDTIMGWADEVAQRETELKRLREKKICCPYCARKYFLTNEGHKLVLVEDLRDREEASVASCDDS